MLASPDLATGDLVPFDDAGGDPVTVTAGDFRVARRAHSTGRGRRQAVVEDRRSIWELDRIGVRDDGIDDPDVEAYTTVAVQGLFAP